MITLTSYEILMLNPLLKLEIIKIICYLYLFIGSNNFQANPTTKDVCSVGSAHNMATYLELDVTWEEGMHSSMHINNLSQKLKDNKHLVALVLSCTCDQLWLVVQPRPNFGSL